MLKVKRTEKEILDDFKKIDGSESRSNFTNKIEALVNEWIENKYDPNIIFKFSDKFNRVEKGGHNFPKEITIADWLITLRGRDGRKTIMEKHLNPHVTCSGGRTTLMLVCQSHERFFDYGVEGYIKDCLELGIDKNAIDDSGKTALDYLLTTTHCESRLEFKDFLEVTKRPELKEVLTGFLTSKEIRTDNIAFVEQISLLEEQVQQLQKENSRLKGNAVEQVPQLQKENLGLKEKLAEQVQRGSIATPKGPINFTNSKESKVVQAYKKTQEDLIARQTELNEKDDEIYQKDKEIAALKERISALETSTKLENPQARTLTSSRGY